jgi:hypothetical protein
VTFLWSGYILVLLRVAVCMNYIDLTSKDWVVCLHVTGDFFVLKGDCCVSLLCWCVIPFLHTALLPLCFCHCVCVLCLEYMWHSWRCVCSILWYAGVLWIQVETIFCLDQLKRKRNPSNWSAATFFKFIAFLSFQCLEALVTIICSECSVLETSCFCLVFTPF